MNEFLVERSDIANTQIANSENLKPGPGEALLRIERFALTANNITYGVAGDMIGYWKFFPADEGWGKIPVWGIAHVEDANGTGLNNGECYYGYFPMSQQLIVKPAKITPRGFVDSAEHRSELPIVYNQYSLMNEENGFDRKFDNHKMVYAPLFTTGFVLDDYFFDNNDFGAQQILVGSASSKTAIGLAFQLKHSGRVKIIGLTSTGNCDFVSSLGLYDEVVSYEEVQSMGTDKATAYIDMSGNRDVLSTIHSHFQDQLTASCAVGITHWQARDGVDVATLPGPKPTMFFAPTQIVKRNQDWGPDQYQARLAEATSNFLSQVDAWVSIGEYPFEELSTVYQEVLAGATPDKAFVVVV